jgi:hypothetical protein
VWVGVAALFALLVVTALNVQRSAAGVPAAPATPSAA